MHFLYFITLLLSKPQKNVSFSFLAFKFFSPSQGNTTTNIIVVLEVNLQIGTNCFHMFFVLVIYLWSCELFHVSQVVLKEWECKHCALTLECNCGIPDIDWPEIVE